LVEHSYNSITNGLVITLAINGSDIYAGGNFYSLGGLKRKNIARINNLTGAADPLWNPGANQDVNFIVADITGLYVGGTFDSIGSVNRKGIAKLEITTGAVDINWNPNPNSNIFFPFIKTMTIVGDDIYVGGHFTEIGGVGINSIAKINTSTGIVDPIWNPSATNYSICEFNSIAVSGENVFVSGDFTEIGGVNRFKLAKLDDVFGSIDVSWDPNPQNLAIIKSLVIDGNDIYIGGNFLGIAGAPINHIARVNKVTGIVDTDWNSNMDISSQVETIAIHGNNIYVGGFFSTVGGII
jgi:hypothetical protein